MAFVDDPNSNQAPQQVAGSAPLSQEQSTGMSQEPSEGSTGGSGGTPMSGQGPTTKAPTKANKGSGKASSGMYTNIQKYVNKNKPQAQNMAGAVTQNVEKQAQTIQNAAQQKKQEQQNLINQNNQIMNQQKQEAANIIYNQTGLQAQGYQPNQEVQIQGQDEATRFRNLMSGPQGTANVGALNLAEQQNRASALQQLAASGRTEQGRRNMLKDTFQKQGAYTQGMSGLDNLIVGGDATARQAIVQGVDETGQELVQNLQGVNQQGQEALAGYQDVAGQFGQEVSGMASDVRSQVEQDVQNRLAAEKAKYDQGQQEFINALQTGQGLTQEMLDKYIGEGTFSELGSKLQGRDRQLADWYANDVSRMRDERSKWHKGDVDTNYAKMLKLLDPLLNEENVFKINPYTVEDGAGSTTISGRDLLGLRNVPGMFGANVDANNPDYADYSSSFYRELQDILKSGRDYSSQGIKDYITANAGKQDFSNLYSATNPEDIKAQDIVTQDQINKFNALQSLTGVNTPSYLPTEARNIDFNAGRADLSSLEGYGKSLTSDEIQRLQNALARYGS